MLGVFVAYIITIVIFAGLYLTVNKVGLHYEGHKSTAINDGDGNGSFLATGGDDIEVPTFCGMDINNHMEGGFFIGRAF